MTSLTKTEIALGRSRSYSLMSRLYDRALDAAALGYVEAIPHLADALPDPVNLERLAADYQELFGFNVYPYQTLFLDDAGQLGGDETQRVRRSFAAAGFRPDTTYADDHLANQLALLAFLSGAEADARRDGLDAIAAQMQARQATFLADHLLRWIVPFVVSVQRQNSPFYAALSELTLALMAEHLTELPTLSPPADLSPNAPSLEDEDTDLHAIVDYLLRTPRSGIYLARADLMRVGRAFNLPRGFGDRRQIFLNLLRTAGAYDAFPALAATLAAEADDIGRRTAALAEQNSVLSPWLIDWQQRAVVSQELLTKLADAGKASGGTIPVDPVNV